MNERPLYDQFVREAVRYQLENSNQWSHLFEVNNQIGLDRKTFDALARKLARDCHWEANTHISHASTFRLKPHYYNRLMTAKEDDVRTPLPAPPAIADHKVVFIERKQRVSGWLSLNAEERLILAWVTKRRLEELDKWSQQRGKLEQRMYIQSIKIIRRLSPRSEHHLQLTA